MPKLTPFNSIQIITGGVTATIDVSNYIERNEVWSSGTITLAGNCSIQPTGTAVTNSRLMIDWTANVVLGTYTVNVFGTLLTQEQAKNGCLIDCYYNGSAWVVNIYVSDVNFPKGVSGSERITLVNGGGTYQLNPRINARFQEIVGSPTLSGNVSIVPTGTLIDGDEFVFAYGATATIGSSTITIFGRTLDSYRALLGYSYIVAKYSTIGTPHWDVVFIDDALMGGQANMISQTIVVTPAEIATLYSSPKTLLPAPGANKYYQMVSAVGELAYQSIPYIVTAGNYLQIQFDSSDSWIKYWDIWFLNATGHCVSEPILSTYSTATPAPNNVNKALILKNKLADPTFGGGYLYGDSPIYIHLLYRIATTH